MILVKGERMFNYARQIYDHKLKEVFVLNGNVKLARDLKIPRSTVNSWIQRGLPNVQTLVVPQASVVKI